MKNNNLFILGVVALVVIVGGYFAFSKNPTPTGTTVQQNSATDNTTAQSVVQNSDDPKLSITADSAKQGWSIVLVGADPVTKDDTVFSDTITDLGQKIERGSLSWAPYEEFTTDAGKFVEVDLKMNNTGRQDEAINAIFAGLFDQADRLYNYQFGYSDCGADGTTESTQVLPPNIPCTMKAIFEVSQDSKSFTLKLFYNKEN